MGVQMQLSVRLAAAGAVAFAAGIASGQTVSPGASTPQPLPVRPGVPGTPREELGIDRAPPLLREGAFVSSSRGVLAKGQSGRWYVVFDRDARGRQMPPMVVLPSANLAAMERIASRMNGDDASKARARILVTGQVMAYQGHNYLLPTAPPILETTAPTAATTTAEPKTAPSAAPTTAAAGGEATPAEAPKAADGQAGAEAPAGAAVDEPSIDQIIGDLDRALGTKRVTNPTTAADSEPAVSETSGGRVRPAGFMTARRGRVLRAGSGESTFIVDSGTAGEVAEPPMAMLPCTNLSVIESLAERMGESATFTISGPVTVYHGRNYLLPTTFTVNRATDQVIPNQ